jgi:hypothetical protein
MITNVPGVGRTIQTANSFTPALPSHTAGRACTLPFGGSVTPYENVNFDWVLADGTHVFYSYRTEELWPILQPVLPALLKTPPSNIQSTTGGVCYNRYVRTLPVLKTIIP